jgi:hypothetical protein
MCRAPWVCCPGEESSLPLNFAAANCELRQYFRPSARYAPCGETALREQAMTRHWRLRGVLSAAGIAAIAMAGPAAAAAGTPGAAAASAGVWHAVPLPGSVTGPAMLDWVTATSAVDAWAVGGDSMTSLTAGTPLVLHWDGNAWAKMPLPAVAWSGLLTSVAASSPSNAWAVGRDTAGLSHVLHWDGQAWRQVPFPGDADPSLDLRAVAAGAHGTAWLVGDDGSNALIERWDGTAWHTVPVPGAATATLTGVRAAQNGVWVTGQETVGVVPFGILLHRAGATWAVVTTQAVPPVQGASVNELTDVLAVSARDVWVVGSVAGIVDGGLSVTRPWIGHWNGTAWDASLQIPANQIDGNSTISPDRAGQPQWVGSTTGINPASTHYAYFNGTAWTGVTGTPLTGVFIGSTFTAHIPGTNATWSVTTTGVDTAQGIVPGSPLIERNDG